MTSPPEPAPLDAHVSIELTLELLDRISLRAVRRQVRVMMVASTVLLAILTAVAATWRDANPVALFVVFALMAGTLALGVTLARRRAMKTNRQTIARLGEFRIDYHLTDEGLAMHSPWADTRYPWGAFRRLVEQPEVWVLQLNAAESLILPAGAMREGLGEAVKARLRAAGAKAPK